MPADLPGRRGPWATGAPAPASDRWPGPGGARHGVRFHVIEAEEDRPSGTGFEPPFDATWTDLLRLRGAGRRSAERWLAERFDDLGVGTSLELDDPLIDDIAPATWGRELSPAPHPMPQRAAARSEA